METETWENTPEPAPHIPSRKSNEEVVRLSPVEVHNSVGCEHYWMQVGNRMAECLNCHLGAFGYAKDGQLLP